jgi:ribosome-binding ATPase YchF (GTP1/OBG family)
MKTFISTIISITFVATILVTVCSLVRYAGVWKKRHKYNKFINPKNTETMLQDELVSQFQEYVDSKQQKSRREHPTNYNKSSGLNNETMDIISRISNNDNKPTPRRDEFGKFTASKYRNQPWWGE